MSVIRNPLKEWVLFAIRLYNLLLLSIPHQKRPFLGTRSTPKWLILEHFWLSAGQKPLSGSYKKRWKPCTLFHLVIIVLYTIEWHKCIRVNSHYTDVHQWKTRMQGYGALCAKWKRICAQFSLCVLISKQWCLSWEIIINKIIINEWVTIIVFLWSKQYTRSSSVSFKSSAIYFFTSGTDWKWVPLSVELDPAPSTELQLTKYWNWKCK